MGVPHSFYLLAALQWGIMAPLNLIKVLRNTPTKFAHHFVPAETEKCQQECGIAQMWATLFWASQIAFSLGYFHIWYYRSAKTPFVPIGVVQKFFVGILLIRAHLNGVVHSPPAIGGVIDLVVGCIMLMDVFLPPSSPSDVEAKAEAKAPRDSVRSTFVEYMLLFAGRPWYPWVVGALSGINNFTMVLSGPLVVLYLSGVLANPAQRYLAAFANAVGTTVGVAVLMYLLAQNEEYIKNSFPTVFNHPTWGKTESAVEAYGWLGVLIISVQPVFLQPLVAICTMADMNRAVLIACVLAGRTIKYIIMAEFAYAGDKRLGFFGSAALDAAEGFKASKTNGQGSATASATPARSTATHSGRTGSRTGLRSARRSKEQ